MSETPKLGDLIAALDHESQMFYETDAKVKEHQALLNRHAGMRETLRQSRLKTIKQLQDYLKNLERER